MKIGNIEFEKNLFLAPMAGVTDAPFRSICAKFGYGLAYTEMVSAKALMYKDKKTQEIMEKADEEPEPVVQIFGSDLEAFKYTVNYLNRTATPIIDINMGCPAPKIVKNGDGSALMKNSELASKIIKTIVSETSKPVTVKIRAGWSQDSKNAVEFSKVLEESGASAIAVHPRTRDMFYSGKADWRVIKEIKEKINIPVIGSRDIFKAEDAQNMILQTGCDAIMVARGAMGNPWIFREYNNLVEGKKCKKVSIEDKKEILKLHMKLLVKYKGEHRAVLEIRKHAAWYSKGEKNASKFKNQVFKCKSIEEIYESFDILKY